jgi:hypothetical protein
MRHPLHAKVALVASPRLLEFWGLSGVPQLDRSWTTTTVRLTSAKATAPARVRLRVRVTLVMNTGISLVRLVQTTAQKLTVGGRSVIDLGACRR